MSTLRPIDSNTIRQLNEYIGEIEESLHGDAIAIVSEIRPGLDTLVKRAIEAFKDHQPRLVVLLETPGGVVEVAERMVTTIRHFYKNVVFVIPNYAMSAGTVFAMSGDKIFMSYFSVLGPIDPQIEKDGKLVPALSYLSQYNRLSEKADSGQLNTAEYALLSKLDLGELHQFEQARELSIDLLENWLSKYKFQDWVEHSSTSQPVTEAEKRERAKEIGDALSDNERWHSHGRGITRETLGGDEIRLRIDRVEDVPKLFAAVEKYMDLVRDYMQREGFSHLVHSREFF